MIFRILVLCFCQFVTWVQCTGTQPAVDQTPMPHWDSLIFSMPSSYLPIGKDCKKYSDYYCLNGFYSNGANTTKAESVDHIANTSVKKQAWIAEFETLIRMHWKSINMFDIFRLDNQDDCCTSQVQKYIKFGFQNGWTATPRFYMDKLTDYTSENKQLTYLKLFHVRELCVNVILEIGFGHGQRIIQWHGTAYRWSQFAVLILDDKNETQNQIYVHYVNQNNPLSFDWFKHNVICKDQMWICNNRTKDKKERGSVSADKAKSQPGGELGKQENSREQAELSDEKQSKSAEDVIAYQGNTDLDLKQYDNWEDREIGESSRAAELRAEKEKEFGKKPGEAQKEEEQRKKKEAGQKTKEALGKNIEEAKKKENEQKKKLQAKKKKNLIRSSAPEKSLDYMGNDYVINSKYGIDEEAKKLEKVWNRQLYTEKINSAKNKREMEIAEKIRKQQENQRNDEEKKEKTRNESLERANEARQNREMEFEKTKEKMLEKVKKLQEAGEETKARELLRQLSKLEKKAYHEKHLHHKMHNKSRAKTTPNHQKNKTEAENKKSNTKKAENTSKTKSKSYAKKQTEKKEQKKKVKKSTQKNAKPNQSESEKTEKESEQRSWKSVVANSRTL